MKLKDIYSIDKSTVLDIIEKHHMRFRVILDRNKSLLSNEYKTVPSWLRFQVEMRAKGKGDLVDEIADIDNTFLLDQMQNEIMEALQEDSTERLKALQIAMATLVNKEKLGSGGAEGEEGSAPTAMTINITGAKGLK